MAGRTVCPNCGTSWPKATARFCGRCGLALGAAGVSSSTGSGSRTAGVGVLVVGLLVLVGAIVGGLPGIETSSTPTADAAADVRLPDRDVREPTGAPSANGPTDPRPRTDPDAGGDRPDEGPAGRLRCEPQGCAQWRVRLTDDLEAFAATSRWIAVADGPRLRVRGTDRSDPGGGGWAIDLREVTADGQPVASVAASGRVIITALAIGADGTVLVAQPDRIFAVATGGSVRWQRDIHQLRAIELTDDHVVVMSAPEGRPDSALERATSLSLSDGSTAWALETGKPVSGSPFGLLTLGPDDVLRLLDVATGDLRWEKNLGSPRWARVEGPWVVASSGARDEALILDGATGEVLQRHTDLVPLGRVQRGGGVAVASWLQRTAGDQPASYVVVTAWDDRGTPLWARQLPIDAGDRCCIIALPWRDGTVAMGRTATPDEGWTIVDALTGAPRSLAEAEHPDLPLSTRGPSRQPTLQTTTLIVTRDANTLYLASGEGIATVRNAGDVEMAATEPPVIFRLGELIGLRLDAAG